MRLPFSVVFVGALFAACAIATTVADAAPPIDTGAIVSQTIRPLMKQYGIPGMSIGVTIDGLHETFAYGVASKATGRRVDSSTLFEIGSITKTFTASLVAYAARLGKLSLADRVSAEYPPLRGTSFERVRLVHLGTHTAGGLPLQFPDAIVTDADAIRYYQQWKPSHPAGTTRLYSNPSIMLLGVIAAARMHANFTMLMQRDLFAPLGLRSTFLDIPARAQARYAQGYTDDDTPHRMSPGPLSPEAYGILTTAADLLRFLDANMNEIPLDAPLRHAIIDTHTGYFRVGAMTQDLIWEQYHYPVAWRALLQGNSDQLILDENPALKIDPPVPPANDVMLNKTGSTGGFSAYVAFIPSRRIGIVLLANKAYPIDARVAAAYHILTRLSAPTPTPSTINGSARV